MTNEQAAVSIQAIIDYCVNGFHCIAEIQEEELEALRTALTALRGWVKTEERVPTEEDGYVIALTKGVFGTTLPIATWCEVVAKRPQEYPYWMPLPPLPEVDA